MPILLGNVGFYGTLAAIRSLGRAGVPVVTLGHSSVAPGRYSRYCREHLHCPPFEQTQRWADWLLGVGRSYSGSAIYATSDAVSYALAKHRDELSAHFALFQPDLQTMMCVLDKGQLLEHARAVGIDTPETWLPRSREEAQQFAREIPHTLIVKPRCQLAVGNYVKGALTQNRADHALMKEFDHIVAVGPHDPDFARSHPEVMLPMFQTYYAETIDRVYSVSGFRDRTGTKTAALGAVKVMQRPRNLGIGLCFEEAPVEEALAAKVFAFCERIGYYGAFEAEFIQAGGRSLLIDFNARFYNQLAFDVARGLDLPKLVYAAAIGDDRKVDDLVDAFHKRETTKQYAFCNSIQFALVTRARRGLGTMSDEEAARWRQWMTMPGRTIVDAAYDADDQWPYLIDAANQVFLSVRYARAFLRDCRRK